MAFSSLPPQIAQLLMAQQMQPKTVPVQGSPDLPPFQLPQLMQTAPLPNGPAVQSFLDRFGPYRLQAFDAMRPGPQVTGGNIGLFQPQGVPEEPARPPSLWSLFGGHSGGGVGRDGGGRSVNDHRSGRTGGKGTGPGGPAGGRSGPVSRG